MTLLCEKCVNYESNPPVNTDYRCDDDYEKDTTDIKECGQFVPLPRFEK
jgi:hypothetical protein